MLGALILIYVPIVLFVVAFLYETYLSFKRLRKPAGKSQGYLDATWEVTHTLLVFGVVMLLMLFTKYLDTIASRIFLATFIAAVFLGVRAACYLYIFYVRQSKKIDSVDWIFAISHVGAAVSLVVVVLQASWFLLRENPVPNTQFIPAFMPGLLLVGAICALPLLTLYRAKG